jgi:hypothetical protein
MKEVAEEVRTYIVKAMCECGGEFIKIGHSTKVSNPWEVDYKYECFDCKRIKTSPRDYPRVTYKYGKEEL